MELVENNYKNIYYIMKHREILNILILVASAFLLVAVLSYFNLYEGMEPGLYEGLEEKEEEEERKQKRIGSYCWEAKEQAYKISKVQML